MKGTLIAFAALFCFAASLAQATLTVYPIADKNTSYSFSLKGEDRGYAIENIDATEGEFYIRLYNAYSVVAKGYKLESDKKGKKFSGGNSSESFTFSPKKGAWSYKASNVNSSFTLGFFDKSTGNPSYDTLFDTKGKASAKGVVDEDIVPTLEEGKKFFGLFCDTEDPIMLVRGKATGKAGKSWKYSETLEDGSKVKFSMKIGKKGDTASVSMAFKTSKFVHPAFITEP